LTSAVIQLHQQRYSLSDQNRCSISNYTDNYKHDYHNTDDNNNRKSWLSVKSSQDDDALYNKNNNNFHQRHTQKSKTYGEYTLTTAVIQLHQQRYSIFHSKSEVIMDEINKIQVEKQKENEQNVQNQNCFDENDINSNIPKLQKATSITINTKCSHNSSMGRTPISDILHVGNDSMDDDDDNISFMTSKTNSFNIK